MTLSGDASRPIPWSQLLGGQLPPPLRFPRMPSQTDVRNRTELRSCVPHGCRKCVRLQRSTVSLSQSIEVLADVRVTLAGGACAYAAADAASGGRPTACCRSIAAAAEAVVAVEAAHRTADGRSQGSWRYQDTGPPRRRCCWRCGFSSVPNLTL